MTDQIEKVSLANAAEQLKHKIHLGFVELLTEEQWKAMLLEELQRFTSPGSATDHWGHRREPPPSGFSKICSEVFAEHLKEEIRKILRSPEWSSKFLNNGSTTISDAIKAWLTENSAALVQSTVQALAAQSAQHIVQGIANSR